MLQEIKQAILAYSFFETPRYTTLLYIIYKIEEQQ